MKLDYNWIQYFKNEKQRILASNKPPIEILKHIFELCKDDFDTNNVKEKLPQLYLILEEFFSNIPITDEQLKNSSKELARFFNSNKDEIRKCDVQLYYALLNFIDMLKVKKIYFNLIS